MQKNTKQKNGKDKTIETFALSAAILTVIITIFPAILIFLVVVFFTGHFYLPSILNLIVSVLIIFAIRKKISQKLWLIPLFFAVSFLLTVNTRLPSIISDWIMPKSAMEISLKKLTLADKTKIKFTSNINLEYKYDPLEAVTKSGFIDVGLHFKEPTIIKEEIDKTLLQMGLILNDEADIEIKVVGKTDSYVTNVTATILENKKLIAQKEFRIRNRYFGDILRFENSPSGEGQKQSSYIAQDTFWQFFFKQARLQDNVVTNFIKQQINVISSKKEIITLTAKSIDFINDPKEKFALDRKNNFSNQKNVFWCNNPDLKINKYNQKFNILEINHKNNIWGLPLDYSPNAIFCYEDKMYVYNYAHNYPNQKDIYTFYIYDYSGKNLANIEYATDIKENSDKMLEYFEVQKDRFLIGLNTYSWYDQEKQEYRNQSYLFYELPKPN